MKNSKKLFVQVVLICIFLLVGLGSNAKALELYLFGGEDHIVFLGCLTCDKDGDNSIWNKYGKYGSEYSGLSIWNKHGSYGSKYSQYSPWNKYGNSAPTILDGELNFYGYFSVNPYHREGTEVKFCLFILENYDFIVEHFDDIADKMG